MASQTPVHAATGGTVVLGDILNDPFYAPTVQSIHAEYFKIRSLGLDFNNSCSNCTALALGNAQERTEVRDLIFYDAGSANPLFGNTPIALFGFAGPVRFDHLVIYGNGLLHNIFVDGSNGGMKAEGSYDLHLSDVCSSTIIGQGADGKGQGGSPFTFEAVHSLHVDDIHCETAPPNSPFATWAANTTYPSSQPIVVNGGYYTTNGGTSGNSSPSFPSQWAPNTPYSNDTYAVPTSGGLMAQSAGGTSGSTPPAWPTSAGTTVNDGTITWTMASFNVSDNGMTWTLGNKLLYAAQAWTASTWQPAGATVTTSAYPGYLFRYSSAGLTGPSFPTFSSSPPTLGLSTTDGIGTATLVCVATGPGSWQANTVAPWRTKVMTSNGIFFANNSGQTGSSTPTWSSATSVGQTVPDNQVTWQLINTTPYDSAMVKVSDASNARINVNAEALGLKLTRPYMKNYCTKTFSTTIYTPQSPLIVGAQILASQFGSFLGNIIEDNVAPWTLTWAYPTFDPRYIDWYDGQRIEFRQSTAGTKEISYLSGSAVVLNTYKNYLVAGTVPITVVSTGQNNATYFNGPTLTLPGGTTYLLVGSLTMYGPTTATRSWWTQLWDGTNTITRGSPIIFGTGATPEMVIPLNGIVSPSSTTTYSLAAASNALPGTTFNGTTDTLLSSLGTLNIPSTTGFFASGGNGSLVASDGIHTFTYTGFTLNTSLNGCLFSGDTSAWLTNASTTASESGQPLSALGTLTLNSVTGFPPGGGSGAIATSGGVQSFTYATVSSSTLTGCVYNGLQTTTVTNGAVTGSPINAPDSIQGGSINSYLFAINLG